MSERKKKRTIIGLAPATLVILVVAGLWEAQQSQQMHEQKENQSSIESQSPADDQSTWEWKVQTFTDPDDGWIEVYKAEMDTSWYEFWYGKTDNNTTKVVVNAFISGDYYYVYCEDGEPKKLNRASAVALILLPAVDSRFPDYIQEECLKVINRLRGIFPENEDPEIEQETTPIHPYNMV